jgi:hypothetical protein
LARSSPYTRERMDRTKEERMHKEGCKGDHAEHTKCHHMEEHHGKEGMMHGEHKEGHREGKMEGHKEGQCHKEGKREDHK